MIPVRLSVKNFLSYGEQVPELDFTPLHVVCLSGANGHGKSALLDAITWAIWGEARKAAGDRKPDEGLIRAGATEMAVAFEFDLEGERYRILRQYQRTGRSGKSTLEFQFYDRETGEYRSYTDTSINRTQQRITETLRMDYTTFINSVFILQGRADEFTKRSARERKQILAEILGLRRYDELRDRARLRAGEAAKIRQDREARLQEIDEKLQEKETCLGAIEALHKTIDSVSVERKEADHELEALRDQRAELASARRRLKEWGAEADRLHREIETLTAQIERQQALLKDYQEALADRERIENAFERYQNLVEERETLAGKLQTLRRLEHCRSEVERDIDRARHEVEKQRQTLGARLESILLTVEETEALLEQREAIEKGYRDLQRGQQAYDEWEEKRRQHDEIERRLRSLRDDLTNARTALQSELGAYQHRLADLNTKAEKIARYKAEAAETQEQLDALLKLERTQQDIKERGQSLNGHIEVLKNKIKLYEHEDEETHNKLKVLRRGDAAHCPLCEASLDERRRQAIEANLGEQIKSRAEEIQRLRRGIKIAEDEKTTLRLQYKQNQPKLETLPHVRQMLAEAEMGIRESAAAAKEIQTLQQRIKALQNRLSNGRIAPDIEREIAGLEREQNALAYDAGRHQAVKARLRELQKYEVEKAKLDDARSRHEKASAAIPSLREQLAACDRQLQQNAYAPEAQARLKAVLKEISATGYDEARHRRIEEDLRQLREAPERYDQLTKALQQHKSARETLDDLESRRHKLQTDRSATMNRIRETEAWIEQAGDVEQQMRSLNEKRTELQKLLDEANRRLGALERQAEHFRTLEAERPAIEQERLQAVKDAQIYEKLEVAFGKNGIQALIIENTIPDIEAEANRILSRLTGNRTQVTIEPLRDLKTGGTRETLDIKISDELGTRDYEMFSGGEAFRTDFAIRIALSKLLAHRAGTRLRTLVIDEGFGTQDTQGLEYLIEALQDIREDFEKIIVVTHLERLKNAFPARIEVVKYPDVGSRFEVVM